MGSASSRLSSQPRIEYGSQSVQGRRASMEDSLLVEYDESNGEGIFAVFDGHNGCECAVFLQKNYGEFLRSQEGFLAKEKHDEIESAMKKAAVEVDSAYLKAAKKSRWSAGSTGIVAFCRGNNLWVSNTGDSRAVAIVDGKPLALSVDQKPDSPEEKKRIEESGGSVVAGRIQGVLAMARAFGNPSLKQQNYLIADPEITRTCIDDDLQFVVLASDGLWDVVSTKRVAKYLIESSQHASPSEMAEGLAMIAHQRGSTDNISVIVLSFKQRTRSKMPPNTRPSTIPIPSR